MLPTPCAQIARTAAKYTLRTAIQELYAKTAVGSVVADGVSASVVNASRMGEKSGLSTKKPSKSTNSQARS